MKKRLLALSLSLMLVMSVLFTFSLPVEAQTKKSFLPSNIAEIFDRLGEGGSGVAGFATSRVSTAMFFALGLLVGFGVFTAFSAALKYIRSQGDAGQIEEAQKAIKAIFYGIAMMFVGIIGIVLIFVFFVSNRPDPSLFQTCLSAPNSAGCDNCKERGDDEEFNTTGNLCHICELWYDEVAKPDGAVSLNQLEDTATACIDVLKGGQDINCWDTTPEGVCGMRPPAP